MSSAAPDFILLLSCAAIDLRSDEDDAGLIVISDEEFDVDDDAAEAALLPTQALPLNSRSANVVPEPAAPAAAALSAAAAASSADAEDDEEGNACIICTELMADAGTHRPAAVKCGHIFGHSCILRWLDTKKRCPQCNSSAQPRDITILYNLPKLAKAVVVTAAAQTGSSNARNSRDLQQQLEQERRKREAAEARLQSFMLKCCRSFYLDVPGTQLLVGEQDASSSRLRRISLLCPQSPSYISLPAGCGHPPAAARVECGVYSWSSLKPDSFQLLLSSEDQGGSCESLAMAADGSMLAASFRAPLAAGSGSAAGLLGGSLPQVTPAHVLGRLGRRLAHQVQLQLPPAAAALSSSLLPWQPWQQQDTLPGTSAGLISAAVQAGKEQLMRETVRLTGHSSSRTMTRGCFLPHAEALLAPGGPGATADWSSQPPINLQQVFVSADEVSCSPKLWCCSSGCQLVQAHSWQQLDQPLLQLSAGFAPGLGALLLGAMSEQQLILYAWEPSGC
eukprot:gene10014-10169_t